MHTEAGQSPHDRTLDDAAAVALEVDAQMDTGRGLLDPSLNLRRRIGQRRHEAGRIGDAQVGRQRSAPIKGLKGLHVV